MTRRAKFLACVLALLIAVPMFGRDDRLVNRGVDPGARGNLHTDNDENGNTRIKVEVEHIATPQQLNPPHQYYVAWIQQNGESPKMLGELKVDRDHANGKLEGLTPAKVFDVMVTAEDQPNPTTPSSTVVLLGHVDRS
jgi:hypothetical protein